MLPAQWVNTVASGVVIASSLVFVFVYATRAPWRSTPLGWLLMVLAAAIGQFGAFTVAIAIWPAGEPAFWLRIWRAVLQLAISGVLLAFARIVVRAQRRQG